MRRKNMEAYIAKRRKKSSKNKILIVIIFMFIIASGIILYKFYEKIDINETNQPPEAVRTLRTVEEEKKENRKKGNGKLFTGNIYNPFFVAAKRWGNNIHTLLYTGPAIQHHFHENSTFTSCRRVRFKSPRTT